MQFKSNKNNNKFHNSFFSDLLLSEGLIEDLKEEFPKNEVELLLQNNINPKLIKHIFKIKGQEPTEDIIPVLIAFNRKKNLLKIKDLLQYKSINELREAIESLGESKTDSSKRIKDEETSIIYNKGKFLVLMPHSTESSCLWGKGTTWCTAATQSGNMFLNYSANPDKNVVLYYIINKESDPRIDPNAKLSLGFINGKPILDGKRGGVSVNAQNEGITERDLRRILGNEEYNHILNLLKIHNESIKGKHPSKEEIKNLALDYEGFMKKLNSFGDNEDYRNDFASIILEQEKINEKILELLSNDENYFVRSAVAKNPRTPEYILYKLSRDKNSNVRIAVVLNPNAQVSILEKLSNDEESTVRMYVAQNQKTPDYILDKLSNDEVFDIKAAIAENLNTSVYVLEKLSNDENEFVRQFVVQNSNTPIHVLEKLSKDKEFTVRYYIAQNPKTPEYILEKLSEDKNNTVRMYVAQNPNTPIHVLERLSNDKEDYIRMYVAKNTSTPVYILNKLSKDEKYRVSYYVFQNLNWIKSRK